MSGVTRYIGPIPVRNLWWLMLYASDLYRVDAGVASAGGEATGADVADLVGRILNDCVAMRLHRQLTHRFTYHARILPRVRGRIDLLRTVRHSLLQRGAVACRFPALSVDTPANRLVRSALTVIALLATAPRVRADARALESRLRAAGVAREVPTHAQLATDETSHAGLGDRRMLAAARLALDLAIPVENAGSEPTPIPDRGVERIWHLFERAVGGFYRVALERDGWAVQTGKRLDWPLDRGQLGAWLQQTLPGMQADIVLDTPDRQRRVVIDTKFNTIVTSTWHRATSLRSGYLYQIYAYLQTQVGKGDALADHAEGLLLHPAIGTEVDECIWVQGHRMRFATVDLAAPSVGIRAQLLRVIGPAPVGSAHAAAG